MTDRAPRLRAVFLAAGFATRLWPLTRNAAKPLLEVGGEPMLTRLLRQVAGTGSVDEVLVVHNGRFARDFEAWREGLSGLKCRTRWPRVALIDDGALENDSRLGAVGDLALALERDPFGADRPDGWLVLAGDNLIDFDLTPYIERFGASGAAQLITRRVEGPMPPHKYNEVLLDERDHVRSFREKPADSRSDLAAIAMYVLPPELPELVRRHLDEGGGRDAPGHLIERLVGQVPFQASPIGGRWFDIGDRDDLEAARAELSP